MLPTRVSGEQVSQQGHRHLGHVEVALSCGHTAETARTAGEPSKGQGVVVRREDGPSTETDGSSMSIISSAAFLHGWQAGRDSAVTPPRRCAHHTHARAHAHTRTVGSRPAAWYRHHSWRRIQRGAEARPRRCRTRRYPTLSRGPVHVIPTPKRRVSASMAGAG
jgi:hypothetical protein